jgi:cysteinyl-tRNA synthetase
LEEKGAAYALPNGDVYFDITRCKDYGKLSHRSADEQIQGSRDLAGTDKRNPADFALWKSASADEIGWDSPWGRGRPGWHIECSAMSMTYLGETFDIHGGGMDLIFPHHENEVAQSETATGKCFAHVWMHNGLTRVKTKAASGEWQTEKMSKSLGNVKELKALLKEYPGSLIRFFLLSTHYRRPIDFSDESLQACQKGVSTIYRTLDRVARLSKADIYQTAHNAAAFHTNQDIPQAFVTEMTQFHQRFLDYLDDDFNTAGAISVLFEMANALNRFVDQHDLETAGNDAALALALEAARLITSTAQIIGLFTAPLRQPASAGDDGLTNQLMQLLMDLRAQARKDKNFALSDTIRDRLTALNITLEDRPGQTVWTRQ